jgi:poly(rC)-binding protein 2/3/4
VCSGGKSAFVTNTTVEIVVPENAFGSVYGENGSNLARLRQVCTFWLYFSVNFVC